MSPAVRRIFLFLLAFLAAVALAACGGTTSTIAPPPPSGGVTISVSPTSASIRAGSSFAFGATVTGSSNTAVTWSVNTTSGGSATLGTIDISGKYTAPSTIPSPNTLTVTATSVADTSKSSSSAVTLLNPTPTLTGVSPASTNLGNFSLSITGASFVAGAQVLLNNAPLPTTFVSSTQLTATGSAASAGTFPIAVMNPDPGSSISSALNLQVNGSVQTSSCLQMSVGQGASLGGFLPFPSDNLWNKDISSAPVDPNSSAFITYIGPAIGIHPDFGSGLYNGSSMGIPYTVVDSTQPLIPINYQAYGSESDPGPMPIPLTAPIEGYPNPGTGDRHVLVLDKSNCFLYELYSSYPQSTSWNADSGAVWDLLADQQRPYTWTSADAAGLSIFPGLVRYDEVAAGAINHAIRFTLQNSSAGFTPPASHFASTTSNVNALPMGARLRLKSGFDVSTFSAANQVILNAMKKYGLIMADNGSSMYISGAPDDRWDNSDLHNLGSVAASNFEVLQVSPLYTSSNVPSGPNPTITSFTASSTSISSGTAVTLSWQVSGASYVIVSPTVGAVRGTSTSVSPTTTTTYTLYAANAFGQTTSSLQITVH
ncbi:MAG: IPT/TIG domain-containing protein [Candidatus Acidiferrum sp.]